VIETAIWTAVIDSTVVMSWTAVWTVTTATDQEICGSEIGHQVETRPGIPASHPYRLFLHPFIPGLHQRTGLPIYRISSTLENHLAGIPGVTLRDSKHFRPDQIPQKTSLRLLLNARRRLSYLKFQHSAQ
jgi:hypothetical protein